MRPAGVRLREALPEPELRPFGRSLLCSSFSLLLSVFDLKASNLGSRVWFEDNGLAPHLECRVYRQTESLCKGNPPPEPLRGHEKKKKENKGVKRKEWWAQHGWHAYKKNEGASKTWKHKLPPPPPPPPPPKRPLEEEDAWEDEQFFDAEEDDGGEVEYVDTPSKCAEC